MNGFIFGWDGVEACRREVGAKGEGRKAVRTGNDPAVGRPGREAGLPLRPAR